MSGTISYYVLDRSRSSSFSLTPEPHKPASAGRVLHRLRKASACKVEEHGGLIPTLEFSKEDALFELRFWVECMGDHPRIIYDSLGAREGTYIQQDDALMKRFDALLERVRQPLNDQQLGAALSESVQASEQLRDLKRDILKKPLVGKVLTNLWPTFYAHALDEVEEFLRILSYYVKGKTPPAVHPLHHDLLWLLDFSGHAEAMRDRLDYREEAERKTRSVHQRL